MSRESIMRTINTEREIDKITAAFVKAREIRDQKTKELRDSCDHDYDSYACHDGVEYQCKKCDHWKDYE